MRQIYHPYQIWEEFINGMWRKESKEYEEKELPKAILFTGNNIAYGAAMVRVIYEWPISCEHNLSNRSINRQAWIGHAACCVQHGWPEYLVRQAWGMLTELQRQKANYMADVVILKWQDNYANKKQNISQPELWNNE